MCGGQYHTLLVTKNYSRKILNLLKLVKEKSITILNFIKSLFHYGGKFTEKRAEILSQPIWNNHFLQKQDSTLFYTELYSRGVSCIRDVVDEQGKFPTWCLAKEKYGLQNQHFLSWLSVIETVAQKWKQQIGRVNT